MVTLHELLWERYWIAVFNFKDKVTVRGEFIESSIKKEETFPFSLLILTVCLLFPFVWLRYLVRTRISCKSDDCYLQGQVRVDILKPLGAEPPSQLNLLRWGSITTWARVLCRKVWNAAFLSGSGSQWEFMSCVCPWLPLEPLSVAKLC